MLPCILALAGPTLSSDERALFREARPAGFILFRRNCTEPDQLRRLTDDLKALTGRADLPILIDQEGGRVSRLVPPAWPRFPAQAVFGDLYRMAPISGMEAARANAAAIGTVLRDVGINIACLPLLDRALPGASDIVGDRAFGDDPTMIASLGRAVLDGLAEAGVAGVIKHMPGHGRAEVDSHQRLPVVDADVGALEADWAPFRRLASRARMGMTAHIVYPAIDAERPATLSAKVVNEIIRGRIGFDGLLLSDDITMSALDGPVERRALAALEAGCDLILHCAPVPAEVEALCAALPPIAPASRERLARVLPDATGDPPPLASLIAKRDALLRLLEGQDPAAAMVPSASS